MFVAPSVREWLEIVRLYGLTELIGFVCSLLFDVNRVIRMRRNIMTQREKLSTNPVFTILTSRADVRRVTVTCKIVWSILQVVGTGTSSLAWIRCTWVCCQIKNQYL